VLDEISGLLKSIIMERSLVLLLSEYSTIWTVSGRCFLFLLQQRDEGAQCVDT